MFNQIHQGVFASLGLRVLNKIAIIAGNGLLPKIIYDECKKQGRETVLITFDGINKNIDLVDLSTLKIHFGKVGKIIEFIKSNQCKDVILVGGFKRPSFKSIVGVDWKGATLISKILRSKGDNNSLGIVIDFLKKENLNVIGVKDILPSLFVKKGFLTNKKPSSQQNTDILLGKNILERISEYDIGQSIVVSGNRVLGIEGPEGTDSLINRCKQLSYDEEPLLVKLAKLNQDIRVDLPTIGFDTIQKLASSGYSGLAIQSSLTIILEKEKVINFANKNNLFIVSI